MTLMKRILVLAPHTDDAELGCGASIVRMLENDREVYIAAFSTAEESLPPGALPRHSGMNFSLQLSWQVFHGSMYLSTVIPFGACHIIGRKYSKN